MKTVRYIKEIRDILSSYREEGKTIGLVPTMGALHDGHLSLIHQCMANDSITVVSIFINPTQFNDEKDFRMYPRNTEKDLELLKKNECHIVFLPPEKEMYPTKEIRKFDFGSLDKHMEGEFRPGHFNGVAQIVTKLFSIIEPDHAYFGEKDFQQLTIIKAIVRQLNLPVQIISCPIIREPDGLAMSSRNPLLTASERISATKIPEALFKIKELTDKMGINELKEFLWNEIDLDPNLRTEYVEIVEETGLNPVNNWDEPGSKRACIAVKVGSIRLIDNIKIS